MLAKLVVHGADRDRAIARGRAALRETVLLGVATNTAYLERILAHEAFASGEVDTGFLVDHAEALRNVADPTLQRDLIAATALHSRSFIETAESVPALHAAMGGWRN